MKEADVAVRDRCLKEAGMPHDTYRKEADSARQ